MSRGRALAGAVLMLLGVGVVWGLSFTLSKVVTSAGAHPFAIAFWQCLGGALTLRALGLRPPLNGRHLRFFALVGLLGAALPSSLIYMAAGRGLSAGALSVCVAVVPMITFALSALIGVERASARRAAGLGLGFAAVLTLIGPGTADASLWALAALGAAASYASENVYIGIRRPPGSSSFALLAGILWTAALYLAPLALFSGRAIPLSVPPGPVEAAFVLQMLGNLLAYGGFVALVSRAGPVFASQVSYVVTLAGVGWGGLFLGERHPELFWLALGLMLTGLALSLPRPRAAAAPATP